MTRSFQAAVLAVLTSFCVAPAVSGRAQTNMAIFGSSQMANPDLSRFTKWNAAIRRIAASADARGAPCAGDCDATDWRRAVLRLNGLDASRQLEAVNRLANRVAYVEDPVNYGVDDYWATPDEFFARGGDCEDYVIAKYAALRLLGWPAERLRMAVVYDTAREIMHAVLVVQVSGAAYMLDNRHARAMPAASMAHYRLIYTINEQAWWFHS
jgi:predicted transglutaminase-like cysteine proteinase